MTTVKTLTFSWLLLFSLGLFQPTSCMEQAEQSSEDKKAGELADVLIKSGVIQALSTPNFDKVKEILANADPLTTFTLAAKTDDQVPVYKKFLPNPLDKANKSFLTRMRQKTLKGALLIFCAALKEMYWPEITGYDCMVGEALVGAGAALYLDAQYNIFNGRSDLQLMHLLEQYYYNNEIAKIDAYFASDEVQKIVATAESKKNE